MELNVNGFHWFDQSMYKTLLLILEVLRLVKVAALRMSNVKSGGERESTTVLCSSNQLCIIPACFFFFLVMLHRAGF